MTDTEHNGLNKREKIYEVFNNNAFAIVMLRFSNW